jgi:VWFA-related protein
MHMGRFVHRLIGAACLAIMTANPAGAQEPEEPLATFFGPVEVPLVSVEVYVSSRDGRPAPGLDLEDFEIFEDGEPVSISHFYAAPGVRQFTEDDGDADDAAVTASDVPSQDLFLVIYFDDTNLSRGRRQAAIDHLRGFLSSALPPDLKVMLVRYDGRNYVEQPFTEETDEVLASLDTLKNSASLSRRLDETRLIREMENATSQAAMSGLSSADAMATSARTIYQSIETYVEQTVHRTRTGIANQKILIGSLSGLSGRKAILLVSNGVEPRPGEGLYRKWSEAFGDMPEFRIDAQRWFVQASRNDLSDEYDDLARYANGHRVTFYTLSALGDGQASASSIEVRSMDSTGIAIDQGMSEEVMMTNMAGTTGGRSLVNSPRLSDQLEEVSEELASYYSLAFEPHHHGDGKYHRLEVKLKNENLRVRHREGYLDVPLADRINDRTLAAAVHGVADNPLRITVATNGAFVPRDDGTILVPVIITVPISQLVLIPSEEEHQGRISILLTVADRRGDISAQTRREYPVAVRNSELTTALNQKAGFTMRLAVRPGRQRIAVGLRDEIAYTEAVTYLEIEVAESGDAG